MAGNFKIPKGTKNGKVKFILSWYYHERLHLNTEQKLELLRNWVNSCIQFEEYEMVVALRKERNKLIQEHRIEKGFKRSFFKKCIL